MRLIEQDLTGFGPHCCTCSEEVKRGTERTNEMWLAQLRDNSPRQAEAIEDLRQYLKWGVLGYLRTRSYILPYLADTELQQMSEDFVRDALLKIHTNLDTFQGKSRFTTWATKIAAKHTIGELRRAKWRELSLGCSD